MTCSGIIVWTIWGVGAAFAIVGSSFPKTPEWEYLRQVFRGVALADIFASVALRSVLTDSDPDDDDPEDGGELKIT